MTLKRLILGLAISLSLSVSFARERKSYKPQVIPEPRQAQYQNKYIELPKVCGYTLQGNSHDKGDIDKLIGQVLSPHSSTQSTTRSPFLRLSLDPKIEHEEGYKLSINARGVELRAKTSQGWRHGLQTLGQLVQSGRLPYAQVEDNPRFAYRGLMLDVSRHFFPTSYIKSLLSEMARIKLNRFHWHLVDGAGWRMESKHYPLLTERAAYRTESDWDKWWHDGDRRFTTAQDPKGYGGYYKQSEIKEVVDYAQSLGITIVPEIELPGHSTELIHAYPELICPTATYQDASDVCIGNEATFTFFERILDETMALFPSKYIHIGGDEAAMNHWGKCPRCQKRMKDEGLKDLHALQSYMIRRIEKYLNSKGRKIIGWDEILMGGLAPDATVMSWRGESGGIAAAQAGHDVVMTPNGNLYLDYYQSEAVDEPRAIGGYVTLEKVYSYNPVPESLSPTERKHILGVQANLWTEYIHSGEHASYMYFPRALALAEVAWSPQEKRNYQNFRERATHYLVGLEERDHKPYPMTGITAHYSYDSKLDELALRLLPERSDAVVRFSDKSPVTAQDKSINPQGRLTTRTSKRSDIYANVFINGKAQLPTDRRYRFSIHKGLKSKVHYNSKWNAKYPANGVETLKDGLWGSPTYLDGKWQGFTEDMDVIFELDKLQELKTVDLRFMAEREQWVYMPKTVEVLISQDGKSYTSLGVQTPKTEDSNPRPVFELFDFPVKAQAKYVRIKASIGRSEGHFIFCDEVAIH